MAESNYEYVHAGMVRKTKNQQVKTFSQFGLQFQINFDLTVKGTSCSGTDCKKLRNILQIVNTPKSVVSPETTGRIYVNH